MRVLVARGRTIGLLPIQERGKELLVHEGSKSWPSGLGTYESCQSGGTDGMIPLSAAWTHEEGLPPETGILGFWDSTVPVSSRTGEDTVRSSQRGTGQRGQSQLQLATRAPLISQAGSRGQSMGRGRGQGPQAWMSGVQGCVYAVTPQAESADQPVIQGTFLLSGLWARVLFDSSASHSFIAASVVIELGLEVETLEDPLYASSPLGIRARIGMICRG